MIRRTPAKEPHRRGALVVMAAVMVAFLLGVVAVGLDLGFVVLIRTQLQAAADAAAMAGAGAMGLPREAMVAQAQKAAARHIAGGHPVRLLNADIEYGIWDTTTRRFTPTVAKVGNAIRVTARMEASAGEEAPALFGRVFGHMSFAQKASAVAMANPRDIAFVVDLSGSMNDDTEPTWATSEINRIFGPDGYRSSGDELMRQVYTDLGFGSFPGAMEHIGQFAGVANDGQTYATLTEDGGPLTKSDVPMEYRILPADSETTRKSKAYSAILEYQIARLMPNALPPPTAANFAYWEKYIDYVCRWATVKEPTWRGTIPPGQDRSRCITGFNNPNRNIYPDAGTVNAFRNMLGYRTYVQFIMDYGRDTPVVAGEYSPVSIHSPYCPWREEETAGGTYLFPVRTQPMHSARRALVDAIHLIKQRNASIPNHAERDRVAIVTFDRITGGGPMIEQLLTGDYEAAMQVCTRLQTVSDIGASTATELGLIAARDHLASKYEGGEGRNEADKIVVLLTDGVPDLYASNPVAINRYIGRNPSSDFYSGGVYALNAPLMQAAEMQDNRWQIFPVGIGSGTDYDFMDRMARVGGTANNEGVCFRGSGSPAEYERRLTEILGKIIATPEVRLVQ